MPGIGDRAPRDPHDQRLDVLALVLAEGRMAPADDACGHDELLKRSELVSPVSLGQPEPITTE